VTGSIVGGFVIAVLNNGLQLMGVGSDKVQMIKGLVLLLAVAVDVYNKSQGRPSITGFLTRGLRRDKDGIAAPASSVETTTADRQSGVGTTTDAPAGAVQPNGDLTDVQRPSSTTPN
jgi:putative multiple sugar transport system permease protein